MDNENNYPILYECAHTVCKECYNSPKWNIKIKCPICQTVQKRKEAIKNFSLISIIEIYLKSALNNKNNINNNNNDKSNINNENHYNLSIPYRCPIENCLLKVCNGNQQRKCLKCKENSSLFRGCEKHNLFICIDKCYKERKSMCFEKKIKDEKFKCSVGHFLSWNGSIMQKCLGCSNVLKFGLSCNTCKEYFFCFKCCKYQNKDKTICFFGHLLSWNGSNSQICLECGSSGNSGISCKICEGFFFCDECCDFKFPENTCPNLHSLKFSQQELNLCSRCNVKDNCSKFIECEYFLCVECKNPFLNGKKFGFLSAIPKKISCKNIETQAHSDAIYSLALINENQLASASGDKTIKIWNLFTNQCLHTFTGHLKAVRCLAFLAKENQLARGSWDNTIRLWDLTNLQCIYIFTGHKSYVYSIAFYNSNLLVSASHDKTIRFWNLTSKQCIENFSGHSHAVTALALIKGNKIASGSWDDSIRIWDCTEKKCVSVLNGHTSYILTLVFLINKNMLVSGSHDKTIKLWNLASQQCVYTLTGHLNAVYSVVFLFDKNQIASGSWDKTIRIWDLTTKQCVHTLIGHLDPVYSLVLIGGNQLASGSHNKTIRLWDLKDKK